MRSLLPFLLVLSFTLVACAQANESSKPNFPEPIGQINDFENILDAKEKEQLTEAIHSLELQNDVKLALVTLDSNYTKGEKLLDYSLQLANYWAVGDAEKNNGILIALSASLRAVSIQIGTGLEEVLTDSIISTIIEQNIISHFKEADFSKGLIVGLEEIGNTINKRLSGALFSTPYEYERYIHSNNVYLSSNLLIQNSYPKGGGDIDGYRGYKDHRGRQYGYGIFFTRMVNRGDNALTLAINFPPDSITISDDSNSFFKLFIPNDPVLPSKVSAYNYGIQGLRIFLDNQFELPTQVQKVIAPGEEYTLYSVLLLHVPDNGAVRTGFKLDGETLSYQFSVERVGATEFSCGSIR